MLPIEINKLLSNYPQIQFEQDPNNPDLWHKYIIEGKILFDQDLAKVNNKDDRWILQITINDLSKSDKNPRYYHAKIDNSILTYKERMKYFFDKLKSDSTFNTNGIYDSEIDKLSQYFQ